MVRGLGPQIAVAVAVAVLTYATMEMIPAVSSKRIIVGANQGGWVPNVNFTDWVRGQQFYLGDWLYFVYDRNQIDVVEVNKTNYGNCTTNDILANWTTGVGRDVVPLNQSRPYYFTTTKGYCFGGMKLAVNVTALPPPPSSPVNQKSDASRSTYRGRFAILSILAVGAVWDTFLRFC